jgi:hypothetical protein
MALYPSSAAKSCEIVHYQQVLRVFTVRDQIVCPPPSITVNRRVGVYVGLRYTSAATRLERNLDPLGRQQR